MSELNPLNDLTRVYLDHVANTNQHNDNQDIKRWEAGNDALDKQMEISSQQLATLGAPQMEEEVSYVEAYLSELKKTTLGSYVKKASKDLANRSFDHGESEKRMYEPDKEDEKETKKQASRQKGIDRAADKLAKEGADPRLAIYQSGMTDASRVKGPVGKAVDKVKDKVKEVLGKKDKINHPLDRYRYQSGLDNYLKAKVKKEEVELDERLGGKGYKSYTDLRGKKISGDWEDSDRGAGNKAKKRAGGKVEKKSPTYQAHVLHKEDKALAYVIDKLRKKHGDNAVLTKGDKMPEPSAAQKKKNAEIRAQRAKEDGRDETEKATSGRYNDRSRSD